jgi:hypothetical protein
MPQKRRLFRQTSHATLPTDPVKEENMMTRNLRSARNQAGLLLLAAGVWLPASAAFAQTVTIDNIETPAGQGFTISVPSVEMTDSNLSEEQVRSLFKGDLSGNAEALANLDAANITIPEVIVTYDIKAPKSDDEESAADDSDAPKSDTESDKADNAAAPAEPAAGGKGEIHYKDLVLDDVKGGVAATVSFGSIDMTGDAKSTGHVPKDGVDNPLSDLADYGITSIDASYGLKAHWDEAADTIEVENFTLHGENLGTFSLSGTLGNATPDLFSNDLEAAQQAAMGLTVKNVTTNVEDLGIGAIALARAGAEQGKSPEEMRQMVAGIAQGSALALLGANEGSQALGQALNAFLMGTNPAITVTLTSIDPAGLGLPDLMELQSDPTQLSSKVKIEAANSGEAAAPAVTPPADDDSRQKDKR